MEENNKPLFPNVQHKQRLQRATLHLRCVSAGCPRRGSTVKKKKKKKKTATACYTALTVFFRGMPTKRFDCKKKKKKTRSALNNAVFRTSHGSSNLLLVTPVRSSRIASSNENACWGGGGGSLFKPNVI